MVDIIVWLVFKNFEKKTDLKTVSEVKNLDIYNKLVEKLAR